MKPTKPSADPRPPIDILRDILHYLIQWQHYGPFTEQSAIVLEARAAIKLAEQAESPAGPVAIPARRHSVLNRPSHFHARKEKPDAP